MKPTLHDSQFDEQNGVLKNKLGLIEPGELTRLAADFASARIAQLLSKPLRGRFDIPHLRFIHRHIFQDVFPWAGDFREVTTSRTSSFSFPPPQYLVPSLEALFAALQAENHLKALDPDAFSLRAGHYLSEINAIHPFREGNGRAQREFLRALALHAGHPLTWAGLTPDENNEASRISFTLARCTSTTWRSFRWRGRWAWRRHRRQRTTRLHDPQTPSLTRQHHQLQATRRASLMKHRLRSRLEVLRLGLRDVLKHLRIAVGQREP